MAYTNITFTEKQKEEPAKLYDAFIASGLYEKICALIPEEEISNLKDSINKTVHEIYQYSNSIFGILDSISQDYKNINLDAEKLQQTIGDSESIVLLK